MLTAPLLTNIDSQAKVFFARTPIHFNIQNLAKNEAIERITVDVYIWRGFQNSVPSSPSVVFSGIKKITPSDNYIAIEIHNEIKAFIVASNLNQNNPQWAYNPTTPSTTSGEGCYFHIVYKVDNEADRQLGTFFATTGYRYNFEKKGGDYLTFVSPETERRYAKGIVYDTHSINLATTVATSYSGSNAGSPMIIKQEVNPAKRELQSGVSCLIAYIDRLGKWDTFTPFGKFVETVEFKRGENELSFRNPLSVNSQIRHSSVATISSATRKFNINTGLLSEKNNYQVREILQSSKIYLVVFGGNVYSNTDIGFTADNAIVTADNTSITADAITITVADLGKFSTYIQIPVRCTTNNFVTKTKLNNKSSISYEIELEESSNFISNIQ